MSPSVCRRAFASTAGTTTRSSTPSRSALATDLLHRLGAVELVGDDRDHSAGHAGPPTRRRWISCPVRRKSASLGSSGRRRVAVGEPFLVAVGGVVDQLLLGQLEALGLALAALDQRLARPGRRRSSRRRSPPISAASAAAASASLLVAIGSPSLRRVSSGAASQRCAGGRRRSRSRRRSARSATRQRDQGRRCCNRYQYMRPIPLPRRHETRRRFPLREWVVAR